jgi:hypothetical protein
VHRIEPGRIGKLVMGALLALLVPLAACSSDGDAADKPVIPASFAFQVDVRLSGSANVRGNLSNCAGAGAFVDVFRGTQVVVANTKGVPLAMGRITTALGTNTFEGLLDECTFQFRIVGVPKAPGYFLLLGRQPIKPIPLSLVVATTGRMAYDLNPPLVRVTPGGG